MIIIITVTIIIILIIIEFVYNFWIYNKTFSSYNEYEKAKNLSNRINANMEMYKKTKNPSYLSNAIKYKQQMESKYGLIISSALTNYKNIYS